MTYDIGDVVKAPELEAFVYDDNGNLANGGTVTVTITKPDGTSTSPSVTNVSTGRYTASYTVTMAGRHKVDWVTTGTNASAYSTSFDVRGATGSLFGLVEAKAYLNITTTTYDDELQSFIDVVSRAVEDVTGRNFRRQTFVQNYDGGEDVIILDNNPVLSVTSVSENGTALSSGTQYDVTTGGLLSRLGGSAYTTSCWADGHLNVAVTYTVGYTEVPAPVRHAGLLMLKHLWSTQRGTMPLARAGAEDEFLPGTTYSVPRRVLELLSPYMAPGIV